MKLSLRADLHVREKGDIVRTKALQWDASGNRPLSRRCRATRGLESTRLPRTGRLSASALVPNEPHSMTAVPAGPRSGPAGHEPATQHGAEAGFQESWLQWSRCQ